MRILHLFDFFSPYGGGTVDLVYKLSSAMAQKGHDVAIYTSDYKMDKDYIASLHKVNVYPFHYLTSFAQFYITPGLVRAVKENIQSFDIVHMHCFRSFQNIAVHYYAQKYGIPYVVDAHGSTPRMGKRIFKRLFDVAFGYRILRDASRCIGETQVGVSEYREFGVSQDKITVIPPPYDTEAFADLPKSGLFRNQYQLADKKIIMFLGRIHWIKGLDFLAESFYELAKSREDVRLVIVGNDDGFKPVLDRMISDLDLSDRVIFTGFLGGQDKLSALVDADVVVQTSRYEQGAWAPFEAVLCGTPIIVSSNSGAGEDVKRIDAGYLVEFGNKNDFKEKMEFVIDNQVEARVKTLQAKAYIEANLSIGKGIEKYENLYESICRG